MAGSDLGVLVDVDLPCLQCPVFVTGGAGCVLDSAQTQAAVGSEINRSRRAVCGAGRERKPRIFESPPGGSAPASRLSGNTELRIGIVDIAFGVEGFLSRVVVGIPGGEGSVTLMDDHRPGERGFPSSLDDSTGGTDINGLLSGVGLSVRAVRRGCARNRALWAVCPRGMALQCPCEEDQTSGRKCRAAAQRVACVNRPDLGAVGGEVAV